MFVANQNTSETLASDVIQSGCRSSFSSRILVKQHVYSDAFRSMCK